MNRRLKIVLGAACGAVLAAAALYSGLRSVTTLAMPQQAFALVTTLPLTSRPAPPVRQSPRATTVKQVRTTPPPPVKPPPSFTTPPPPPPPVVAPPAPPAIVIPPPPPPAAPPLVTPATPAPAPTPPPVAQSLLITEVFVGSETSGNDEFIELYNPGDQPVDLTGWSIKKKTSSGNTTPLVAVSRLQGRQIAPQAHFVIARDGSTLTGLAQATWAKSNSLAAKNNAVGLYAASGALVDQVGWAEIPKGSSYARSGLHIESDFTLQSVPTPGR